MRNVIQQKEAPLNVVLITFDDMGYAGGYPHCRGMMGHGEQPPELWEELNVKTPFKSMYLHIQLYTSTFSGNAGGREMEQKDYRPDKELTVAVFTDNSRKYADKINNRKDPGLI